MSHSSVLAGYLLHGAYYALEQCGCLLRDARILFLHDSFASTFTLSVFAHEELGRERRLLELRAKVSKESVTLEDIREACKPQDRPHETKLERSGLGALKVKLLHASNPQRPEYQGEADRRLSEMHEAYRAKSPNEIHNMASLFVEPNKDFSHWNRPTSTTPETARGVLRDAINAYAMKYDRRTQPALPSDAPVVASIAEEMKRDAEIFEALGKWKTRPELWKPDWTGLT